MGEYVYETWIAQAIVHINVHTNEYINVHINVYINTDHNWQGGYNFYTSKRSLLSKQILTESHLQVHNTPKEGTSVINGVLFVFMFP